MKSKDAKQKALSRLTDCWGKAAAVIMLVTLMHMVLLLARYFVGYLLVITNMLPEATGLMEPGPLALGVNVGFMVISLVALSPVLIGCNWWFIHGVRGDLNPVRAVFVCYSTPGLFFRTVALRGIIMAIRVAALIPVGGVLYFTYKSVNKAMETNNSAWLMLLICGAVASLCLITLYIYFFLRFALCGYLFAVNPDRPLLESITLSFQIMRHKEIRLIKLIVSFFPWYLACLLLFPIFFVAPYFFMSYTAVISRIMAEGNQLRDRCQ